MPGRSRKRVHRIEEIPAHLKHARSGGERTGQSVQRTGKMSPTNILSLQQTIGNQAVQRMLQRQESDPPVDLEKAKNDNENPALVALKPELMLHYMNMLELLREMRADKALEEQLRLLDVRMSFEQILKAADFLKTQSQSQLPQDLTHGAAQIGQGTINFAPEGAFTNLSDEQKLIVQQPQYLGVALLRTIVGLSNNLLGLTEGLSEVQIDTTFLNDVEKLKEWLQEEFDQLDDIEEAIEMMFEVLEDLYKANEAVSARLNA